MRPFCDVLTNLVVRPTLICWFFLVSILPLYAQQSGQQSNDSSAINPDSTSVTAPSTQTSGNILPSAPSPQTDTQPVITPDTLAFGERVKIYEHSLVSPEGLIGPVLGASIGQADNTPHEWGQGAAGFGTRLGSAYGRSIIARTIALGVATVDREDSRFVPSGESGVWHRTRHAIVGTFVSRTESGGRMPAISRFLGVYGAGFIANAWEPPSQDHSAQALERGSTALLSSVGWHVFEEFWPDIRHTLHHDR
jgi:hypothetical protein